MSEMLQVILDKPVRKFNPSQLAGLKLWLDASYITGLVDADPVTTWSDRSGNGNNATQATADNKPAYKVNILNGKPVVRFAGNDWLQMPEFVSFSEPTLVMVWLAGAVGMQDGFWDNGPTDVETLTIRSSTGTSRGRVRDSGSDAIQVDNGSSLAFYVATLVLSGTTLYMYHNGTEATGTNAAYNATTWEGTFSPPLLGAAESGSGNFLTGDIAEVIMYNRALSTAERRKVEKYLSSKYAITVV